MEARLSVDRLLPLFLSTHQLAASPTVSSNVQGLLRKATKYATGPQLADAVKARPDIREGFANVISAALDHEVILHKVANKTVASCGSYLLSFLISQGMNKAIELLELLVRLSPLFHETLCAIRVSLHDLVATFSHYFVIGAVFLSPFSFLKMTFCCANV